MREKPASVSGAQPGGTTQAVALLHEEHERQATLSERFAERAIGFVARPLFVELLSVAVVLWVSWNALAVSRHLPAFDPPPCSWLQGILSLAALFMTVLILATQRRAGRLADHRSQLTLEIAIIAEQKTAKLIGLLEELRRDHPEIADRHDSQAHTMARSTDAEALSDAIKGVRAEIGFER